MYKENLLSFSNSVFSAFTFYTGIIVLKVLIMAVCTGSLRRKNLALSAKLQQFITSDQLHYTTLTCWAFSNPEDAVLFGIEPSKKNVNIKHPAVERFVRAHRNDLENVISFLFVGLLYVLTNPPYETSVNCFRIFTIARIIHSFASVKNYQVGKYCGFGLGLITTVFMIYKILLVAKY